MCSLFFGVSLENKTNNFVTYGGRLYKYFSTGTVGDYFVCKEALLIIRILYEKNNVAHIVWVSKISYEESKWDPKSILVSSPISGLDLDEIVELNK